MRAPFRVEGGVIVTILIATLTAACTETASGPTQTYLPATALIVPASVTPSPSPRPTPRRTIKVPASIDATGRTDVSQALQAFVDSVPDHSVVRFPTNASYRLDGDGIVLDGRQDLVFIGHDVQLSGAGCDVLDSLFIIGARRPSSAIRIEGLTLIGDNAAAGTPDTFLAGCEYQMGVAVYGSSDVEISDVTVRSVRGDCLYVGGRGDPFIWSSDVTFRDSVCSGPGRMGVAVVAGQRVSVERVDVDAVGISAFDIEPNDALEGAADIRFSDNTVGTFGIARDWDPSWLLEANGSPDAVVRGVVAQGNRLSREPVSVKVQVPNRYDVSVLGNSSTVPAQGPVMRFEGTIGVTVRDNQQPLTGGELASFTDCSEVDYDG